MNSNAIVPDETWKNKALAMGLVIGALTGLGAAYLLVQRAEQTSSPPHFSAGEGVKLSLLLLGLVRQVGQMFE